MLAVMKNKITFYNTDARWWSDDTDGVDRRRDASRLHRRFHSNFLGRPGVVNVLKRFFFVADDEEK
jgi:hypothetical protein